MSTARRIIAILVALYVLLVLLDRFVLVQLFFERAGVPILFALAGGLACIGTGFLARRLRQDVALNFVVGYPIFGAICFLVGLLKISPWTMVPVVGLLGGVGLLSGGQTILSVRPGRIAWPPLILVFLAAFIAAQAPPSTLDELAYHLAVPWTWVKEGRAIALPLLSHSYFPLGVESADLPSLSILGATSGGIASHFLHLFAAIAVTALLLRRTKDSPILTAAIVATPALALTAGWSFVDWPLLGVSLALVDAEDDATRAAALGAGLLTKYTFLPIALIAILLQRKWRALWPGAVIGSVFFIRNLILTGNPLAPFLSALAPHVTHYRGAAYLSDYIFSGAFIDESLGASLMMTIPLAIGVLSWCLVAAGGLLFALSPSSRLLVPFFALPATRALPPNRPLRVLLAIAIGVQLCLIAFFVDRTQAFALLSGHYSDEQYLAAMRPSTMTVAALDAALPPQSLTLVIGLNESYWFQHRVRAGGNFDGPRLSAYLEAGSIDALYARLRYDGITHVAVVTLPPPTEEAKKLEERETLLSDAAKRTLAQMLDARAGAVTQRGTATLFALR